ncbi:MAG: hypothetical protein ACOY99_10320 [Pseudomonadota bacterium]
MTKTTQKRLFELIKAYGANPARWPASERMAAEMLMTSPAARRQLGHARVLDAALDAIDMPAPSAAARAALQARILEAVAQTRQRPPRPSLRARLGLSWRWLAAEALMATAAGVLGFYLGGQPSIGDDGLLDQEIAVLLSGADFGIEEFPL